MGLEEAQVAEVYVPASDDFGSGYLVSPRLVLTARHVVATAVSNRAPPERPPGPLTARLLGDLAQGLPRCQVRLLSRTAGRPFHDAVAVWWHEDVDAVLLAVLDEADTRWVTPPRLTGLTWADLDGAEPVDCLAAGFPIADAVSGGIRESRELDGTILPLSQYKSGRWVIQAHGTIGAPRAEATSAWAGMSGAVVFADGLMIGVLQYDADPGDPTRMELWAEPARAFAADDDFAGWLSADGGDEALTRSSASPQRRIRLAGVTHVSNYRGGADQPGVFSLSPPVTSLPERVRGREEVLSDLAALLTTGNRSGRPQVLVGLGGAGKTTVALHLAGLARSRRVPAWWMSARDAATLSAGMRELALTLGAAPKLVQEAWEGRISATDLLWRSLDQQASPWLLIVDEADDPEVLAGPSGFPCDDGGWLRPTTNGLIVITSRDASAEIWRYAEIRELPTLGPEPASQVILDAISPVLHPGSDQHSELAAEVASVADRLGGLPLALNLAGTYLRQKIRQDLRQGADEDPVAAAVTTIAAYRETLDQSLSVLDSAAYLGGRRSEESITRLRIYRTWEISLDLLDRRGYGDARQLIEILSCFAPEPLPLDLLDPEVLAGYSLFGDAFSELRRDELLQALDDLSLVRQRAQPASRPGARPISCVSTHRLVLDTVAANLSDDHDRQREVWTIAVALATVGTRRDSLEFSTWAWWELLAPHVQSALSGCPPVEELVEDAVMAALCTFGFVAVSGKIRSAIALARAIQTKAENILPADHRLLVLTRIEAGQMMLASGRFKDTEDECQHLLAELRDSSNLDDEDKEFFRLLTLPLLAHALVGQYRLTEAEDAFRSAVDSATGDPAVDQMLSRSARLGLADALGLQEKLADAEAELRVVAEAEDGTGDTVIGLLARVMLARIRCKRNIGGAEAELRTLLDAQGPVLGANHPVILAAAREAAGSAARRGDLGTAEAEIRAVLEAERQVLGDDHPQTLATRYELAVVLRKRGRLEAAETEFRAVLAAKRTVPGQDDRSTLITRHELALTLRERGQLEAAEAEFRAVLAAKREVMGLDDRSTLITWHELAVTLRERGQLAAAETEIRAVLTADRQALGGSDGGTLITWHELAVTLRQRGQLAAAETEIRAVLAAKRETLGQDDRGTLITWHELAVTLRQRGQLAAAETEIRAVLAADRLALGGSDRSTLITWHELAVTLRQRGQLAAAEPEIRAVLAAKREALGQDDRSTLASWHELAVTLRDRGQFDAAETEIRPLLAADRRVLGDNHLQTLAARHELALLLRRRGQLDEAETEFRAVLAAKREALGQDDRNTLVTWHELAVTLRRRGQLEAAETEVRGALAAERRALGETDGDTLGTRLELAFVLRQRGQLEAAETEIRTVLSARTETLGRSDRSTLGTRHELALTLRLRGELEAAETEIRTVLAAERQAPAGSDRSTLDARCELAAILRERGQLEAAETEIRTVLAAERQALGGSDRSTLNIQHELALVLRERGQLAAAEREFRAELSARTEALGQDDRSTLITRHELGVTLHGRGQLRAAETEIRTALAAERRALGGSDRDTLATRHELALILRERRQLEAAEAEFRALLEAERQALGGTDRSTLITRHELGVTLRQRGQLEAAGAEFRALLEAERQALGDNDRETLGSWHELAEVLLQRGQLTGAEAEFRAVLTAKTEALGEDDRSTLVTRLELAAVLLRRGELAAVQAARETSGPGGGTAEQGDSAAGWQNLADGLARQHKLGEAVAEFRALLEKQRRVLGPGQRVELLAQRHLSNVLVELGAFTAAESGYRTLLDISRQALGGYHEIALQSRLRIAQMLRLQNKLDDAIAECQDLLDIQLDVLGAHEDHRSVLPTRYEMIRIAIAGGYLEKAEDELSRLADAARLRLGEDHLITLDIQNDLFFLRTRLADANSAAARLQALLTAKTQISAAVYITEAYRSLCFTDS